MNQYKIYGYHGMHVERWGRVRCHGALRMDVWGEGSRVRCHGALEYVERPTTYIEFYL